MAVEPIIWCGHCRIGFALLRKPYPPTCPNESCGKEADWRTESPTPRHRYNLTPADCRTLRSYRIRPE